MSFAESITSCFSNWITFSGRAPRSEYWWFTLFSTFMAVAGILSVASVASEGSGGLLLVAVPAGLLLVAIAVASVSVTVRRLHDRGLSGWWYGGYLLLNFASWLAESASDSLALVLSLLTLVAGIALFVQTVMRGTEGEYAYGPDPLALGPDDAAGAAATPAE